MNLRHVVIGAWILLVLARAAPAGAPPSPLRGGPPPGEREPVLRLEAGGPTSAVTGLVFGPRGDTLYVGGYDKVIRAWQRGPGGRFGLAETYRVPIGPGVDGVLNALALSADGRWLAAGGTSVVREASGFREPGMVIPRTGRLSRAMLEDQGTVYLFDTTGRNAVRLLRGHQGPVLALAFAPARADKPPLLLSLARETRSTGAVGVLRLWDAARAEALAQSESLPDPGAGRPALAAWHTGEGPRQLGVALACSGEALRIWTPEGNRLVIAGGRGILNDTAVFVPDSRQAERGVLFTGSYAGAGARLQAWTVAGASGVDEDPGRTALLARGCAPQVLTLLPTRGEQAPEHAAAVLRFPAPDRDPNKEKYRLVVFQLPARPGTVEITANVPLWTGGRFPALATSPDGEYLAVSGNRAHEVLLFNAADLAASRPPRLRQRLRSVGVGMRRVAFVRRDNDRGLLLEPEGQPDQKKVLIFDVSRRRFSDGRGWEEDVPDKGRWTVEPLGQPAAGITGYTVKADDLVRQIRLLPGQQATCAALLPPLPPLNIPLLAVAFTETGVPYLALHDVQSGRQVRLYTGHVNPIRGLAFSQDGRLLASAAEDQTVCVWSLTDLGETLGRHGTLRGLAVGQADKGLRVVHLDPEALSASNRKELERARVAPGDAIEGLLIGKEQRRAATPQAFYEALWQCPPGTKATLQVRGKGEVQLALDQGVDDRKPLFTLFVAGIGDGEPEWVGWNPCGPYDTGNPARGERHIGWHRNTGDAAAPVSFSLAGEYRKSYFREGILAHLLRRGNLDEALDDWKRAAPPAPRTSVWIEDLGPDPARRDAQGHPLVQTRSLTVKAAVHEVPLSKVHSVRWRLDNGRWQDLGPDFSRERTAELDLQALPRGLHEVRVLVSTIEDRPPEYSESLWLHYLPPPPAVHLDPAWLRKQFGNQAPDRYEVHEARFVLEATVTPGLTGPGAPPVKVSVRHGDRVYAVAGPVIRKELTLVPGNNVLEVRAENEGSSGGLHRYESAVQTLVVRYVPPRVIPPPQITLETVAPAEGEPLRPRPGQYLTPPARQVRILGRVSAEEDLTEATLNGKPLTGFDAGRKPHLFRIDEQAALAFGKQELVFRARTARAEAQPQRLRLDYRPELPTLSPTQPRSLTRRATEPLDFALEVRLAESRDPHPFQARVRHQGERETIPAMVDREGTLSARLRLHPGPNVLEVVLTDAFGGERTEEVRVYCQRPPRIEPPGPVPSGSSLKKPLTDLQVRVRTPKGLPLRGARLNGRDLGPEATLTREGATGDDEVWQVRVPGVALRPGDNKLVLDVRNDDGYCLEPAAFTVRYTEPKPPPRAEVALLEPLRDLTVSEARVPLRFTVRSASKARVTVLHGGQRADPGKPSVEGGLLVYRVEVAGLKEGPNDLQVQVVNDGGETLSPRRIVSYVRRTIRVHLDGLERPDQPTRLLPLDGCAPVGVVRLRGHVDWPEPDPSLRQPLRVRVWVNDFEQFDAPLAAPRGLRRTFRVELRFNQETNRVQLRFPGLRLEEGEQLIFQTACATPEKEQRLHLLVVAPGRRDQKAVVDQVLKAFLARDVQGGRFRTPAFREGRVYGPLPWNVKREEVYGTLINMRRGIRRTAGPFNDVVVVYFQGEEALTGDRHYLLTEESLRRGRLAESALNTDTLREVLAEVQGAKLLLLDVAPKPGEDRPPARAEANDFPHVGFIRYVWLGPTNAPEEAHFVHALQQSLSRAVLFKDVKQRAWLQTRDRWGNQAVLHMDTPLGLDNMEVGNRTE